MKVLKQFNHEVALSFSGWEMWNSELYKELYRAAHNNELVSDIIVKGIKYPKVKVTFIGSVFNTKQTSKIVELQEVKNA